MPRRRITILTLIIIIFAGIVGFYLTYSGGNPEVSEENLRESIVQSISSHEDVLENKTKLVLLNKAYSSKENENIYAGGARVENGIHLSFLYNQVLENLQIKTKFVADSNEEKDVLHVLKNRVSPYSGNRIVVWRVENAESDKAYEFSAFDGYNSKLKRWSEVLGTVYLENYSVKWESPSL